MLFSEIVYNLLKLFSCTSSVTSRWFYRLLIELKKFFWKKIVFMITFSICIALLPHWTLVKKIFHGRCWFLSVDIVSQLFFQHCMTEKIKLLRFSCKIKLWWRWYDKKSLFTTDVIDKCMWRKNQKKTEQLSSREGWNEGMTGIIMRNSFIVASLLVSSG